MNFIKNKKNALTAAVGVSLFLLAGSVLLAILMSGTTASVFSAGRTGSAGLQLSVVEGFTETPIEDAAVIIVETGDIYYTDAEGNTDVIQVPFIRDTRYDDILEKPWGEVSLIVYKNGYVPYALFYLQVLENETRQGVKILLFSDDQTESDEPFSIIEGPNRVWVDALIDMYQPKED